MLSITPTIYNSWDSSGKTDDEKFKPSREQMAAPNNKIKSTRFNVFSFVPIALFLQYKKVVVCFYTFNTVMQSFPSISTNSPLASLIPVVFIILLGMLKELYLECKRMKDDKRINTSPCLRSGSVSEAGINFEESQVQFIRVGDILKLKDDDYVPADCVILQVSQENGQCFTQTDALDGERNFKSKLALEKSQKELASLLCDRQIRIFAPQPTTDLYDFKGSIEFGYSSAEQQDSVPLLGTQFIPRGSTIKNSGEIAVLVVYTGNETKLMQNLGSYKFKRSQMEKRTGTTLLVNLAILISFITISSVWNTIKTKDLFETHTYLTDNSDDTATSTSLSAIVSFYLLFNYLVPLDLAVMLELNAIFYSGFIPADAKMTHINHQMGRIDNAKTNSLNLLENLGEVEYIMSDKTGTLTQNELTFVSVCADESSSYLQGQVTSGGAERKEDMGTYLAEKTDFLRCLSLCHDCTMLEVDLPKQGKTKFLSGSSLDEQCLINHVKSLKIGQFIERTASTIKIEVRGIAEEYDVLAINEFTSERKIMSVIVRDRATGQLFVYAKGAESKIASLLNDQSNAGPLKTQIEAEVYRFGSKGLRTLVFAMRPMSEEELKTINLNGDPSAIAAATEKELTVIACTGVEDDLQEDVAEVIQDFRDAGIKFWMLTGDLGHTAKEIGFNCGILSRDSDKNTIYNLEDVNKEDLECSVTEIAKKVADDQAAGKMVSVLISGSAFTVAMQLDEKFLTVLKRDILLKVDSVILYRSSPMQKAIAVNLVKSELKNKKTTLAIGDGFNDVNMIQSAHVGIGVQGKESNQAAAFADYSIPHFRDLRRLMFWHGRAYGHNTLFFIILGFMKIWNRMWVIWVINGNNGMSAVTDINGLFYALFAVCFMNFQVVAWNTFNTDVNPHLDEKQLPFKYSDLYTYCRKDIHQYHWWYLSMVLFIAFPVILTQFCFLHTDVMGESGTTFGFLVVGITGTFQIVIAHHVLISVITSNFDVTYLFFLPFSFMWVWVVAWLEDGNKISTYYSSILSGFFQSYVFWLQTFLGVALMVIPIYAWLKWRQFFGGDPRYDITYQKQKTMVRGGDQEGVIETGQVVGQHESISDIGERKKEKEMVNTSDGKDKK